MSESIESIVAVIRKCAQRWEKLCEGVKDSNLREALKPQTEIYSILADRLEAAAKRDEERAVEHATRHAEAVARDNCRDCVHNPSGKNYEGGNAAAMREALERFMGWYNITSIRTASLRTITEAARAALAAPQRNCDLYDTQPTMSMAYEAYRKAAMRSYGNGLTGAVPTVKQKPMTYDEWILAPAAEQEGGAE